MTNSRHHSLCIPGDALIATPGGPVPMSEIKAGDEVYALDPSAGLRVTRVVRQRSTGAQPVRRIETAGRSLRVTATHPVLTVAGKGKRGGALAWRPAGELAKDDVIVCAEGYGAEDGPQSVALARLMGAFLGMGYIERGRVGATVGQWCDAHADRYHELFEGVFPGAGWVHGAGLTGGISCADAAVAAQLEGLGFISESAQRRVPGWAFSLPRDAKLALLAGYMDAAGRMARDSKKALTGAGTIMDLFAPRLVTDLRELAISAGLDVSTIQHKRPSDPSLSGYRFAQLSAPSMAALPCWDVDKQVTAAPAAAGLPSDKLGGVVLPAGAFAQKIKVIEEEAAVEVFELEVEDDTRSFIAEGVVVHSG